MVDDVPTDEERSALGTLSLSQPSAKAPPRGLVSPLVAALYFREPPKLSKLVFLLCAGRPIGAILEALVPLADVMDECIDDPPCTCVEGGPEKKLKAAAEGEGELVEPEMEAVLECPAGGLNMPVVGAVPEEAVLPDKVRPDSLSWEMLCVRG